MGENERGDHDPYGHGNSEASKDVPPTGDEDSEDLLAEIQQALKDAQEASEKLARLTQKASSALGSYTKATPRAPAPELSFLKHIDQSQQKPPTVPPTTNQDTQVASFAVSTERSSVTGQLYFIANVPEIEAPPKPSATGTDLTPDSSGLDIVGKAPVQPQATAVSSPITSAPQAPAVPVVPVIPEVKPSSEPQTPDPETPAFDLEEPASSSFFAEGTETVETAKDFETVLNKERPTPKTPFLVYLIVGCIAAIATSATVFSIPQEVSLSESAPYPLLVGLGFVLFLVGFVMALPVWISSRDHTSNHKGLFSRAMIRAALCTTLVVFLWMEALIISDMFRLGQLSL